MRAWSNMPIGALTGVVPSLCVMKQKPCSSRSASSTMGNIPSMVSWLSSIFPMLFGFKRPASSVSGCIMKYTMVSSSVAFAASSSCSKLTAISVNFP